MTSKFPPMILIYASFRLMALSNCFQELRRSRVLR